jgi:tRNA-specific 2-thiouridylase
LGKISYNDFLLRYLGERVGKIIELESGRMMGEHRGYWFHTIGQRKGLGLSGGPWYVVGKSMEENLIYVSRGYDVETQYGKSLDIDSLHFLTHDPWGAFTGTREIAFKIRHTPEFTRGILSRSASGGYHIESESKLQGIAAGQFAVIYDASCRLCIGSGTII